MPSAIDATKPANNSAALTSDLRANLAAAKSEIEALQAADLTLAPKGAVTGSGLTMATNKLLGRNTASTGAVEEITLGTNLSMTGTTLNAAGGSPGGSTTQVQYNNAGAFAGNANFTINNGTGVVTFGAAIDTSVGTMTSSVANGASAKAFSFNTSGAYTTTAKLASWSNNSVEKVYFVQDGGVFADNFCPSGPSGPNTTAKIYGGGNQSIKVKTNNQDVLYLSGQGNYVQTVSDAVFSWTPSTDITVGPDTALARDVAGRVSVLKSRTASDYGDLKVRNAILTGNLALGIVAKTANYTVTANDHTIECDATSGAITLTLPAVSGAQAGTQYTLKKTDASANAVTFDGNASETIDGATTVSTTTQWASITIRRNAAGTAWITTKD